MYRCVHCDLQFSLFTCNVLGQSFKALNFQGWSLQTFHKKKKKNCGSRLLRAMPICFSHTPWLDFARALCSLISSKEFRKSLCPLASELVKDHQCWVVRWKLQFFPLSTDVRKEDRFDVHFRSGLVWPMVIATCDVPIGWSVDARKTPFGGAFVD